MRQLVQNHCLIERTVSLRVAPQIHLRAPRAAIGRSREVGVVRPAAVLHIARDGIAFQPAAIEIAHLKVARRFSEAEGIENVVITIDPVKQMDLS